MHFFAEQGRDHPQMRELALGLERSRAFDRGGDDIALGQAGLDAAIVNGK